MVEDTVKVVDIARTEIAALRQLVVKGRTMRGPWLLFLCVAACAAPPAATPARANPLFEFHSDPWLNLHQRLLAETQGNNRWHVAVAPCACARANDGAIVPAWSSALETYRTEFKDRDPAFDRPLRRMNFALALEGTSPTLTDSDDLNQGVARALAAAFEPYTRAAWPEDDVRNKAWMLATEPLVARWGAEIASELAKRFETSWPIQPIRVEVSRYAGWAGAYTTRDPILITMSSEDPGYQGQAALEMLFHEASHGLTGVLEHDLDMVFAARGKRAPDALDHVIIFYTAGELVRRRLGPGYVPYAYKKGVYKRGWETLESAVRTHWQAWLDDRTDLSTALARLADAL
jgi:hypothetical protein